MKGITVRIITRSKDLPELSQGSYFHSSEFFSILEHTPGITPYMAVCFGADGKPRAHMLAMLRRRGSLVPPSLFSQGRVYGSGVYLNEDERNELFPLMLDAVTHRLTRFLCLYIEISDMPRKMFGYRDFRRQDYFPVPWMQIHNSLHSLEPAQRLDEHMRERIEKASKRGLVIDKTNDTELVGQFSRILHRHYSIRLHRFIPKVDFFTQLAKSKNAQLYIARHDGKVIGGCVVIYSEGDAYLWFDTALSKRHPLLRPRTMTVWAAIVDSWQRGYQHIRFLNVGLPFSRNRYREFILSFGGKPVSSYRWFHFTIGWLNKLLTWLYRE